LCVAADSKDFCVPGDSKDFCVPGNSKGFCVWTATVQISVWMAPAVVKYVSHAGRLMLKPPALFSHLKCEKVCGAFRDKCARILPALFLTLEF
jgi:hypothetical protein